MASKAHFITFSNSGYTSPERILTQAKTSGFFRTVRSFSERDIVPLIQRHPIHFAVRSKQGFGRFMWKPYLILEQLREIETGDFLVYADLGTHINKAGEGVFLKYLRQIEATQRSVGVFEVSKAYKSVAFVRQKAVMEYLPEFYSMKDRVENSVYAGLIIARKTLRTEIIFSDWLYLCERYLSRPDFGQRRNELPGFAGQDADSGFLPLVLSKHQDHVLFPGTDVNLYDESGIQLSHALGAKDYREQSWETLSQHPFNLRRDR